MNTFKSVVTASVLFANAFNVHAFEGRVLFLPSCPVTSQTEQIEETAGLAVAFLSKLASSLTGAAIDSLANALSNDRQVSITATERMPGWYAKAAGSEEVAVNSNLVCVVVMVAEGFGERNEAATPNALQAAIDKSIQGKNYAPIDLLNLAKIRGATTLLAKSGLNGPPAFYMELAYVKNRSGSVFSLQPKFVHYPEFLGPNVVFGPSTRDLLVQIEFSEPGSTSPFADAKLQFNGLTAGGLSSSNIGGIRLPWSNPPASEGVSKSTGVVVPFNVKLLVAETAKPGTFGRLLGGVLKDQKESIASAIETKVKLAISDSERQAARNSATESASTALTVYLAAFDANEAAKKMLVDANGGSDLAAKAKAANAAAVSATRLRNAEVLARSAFNGANLDFTPVPVTP